MVTAALFSVVVLAQQAAGEGPVRLHAENRHYFDLAGRAGVLVTSGEHYGAVLNLDFDHTPYLDALAKDGLNQTRTFSGTYREVPGSFQIRDNTLAPKPNRYRAPWARVASSRSSVTACALPSGSRKSELPATSTLAPAPAAPPMVEGPMPPSTSMSTSSSRSTTSRRSSAIFGSMVAM